MGKININYYFDQFIFLRLIPRQNKQIQINCNNCIVSFINNIRATWINIHMSLIIAILPFKTYRNRTLILNILLII